MENFRNWFLLMLILHKRASPSFRGGAPGFYEDIIGDCFDSASNCKPEFRCCGHLLSYFESAEISRSVKNVRKAFEKDDPALIIEGKSARRAALFSLTAEGERRSAELLFELSEQCIELMRVTILEHIQSLREADKDN